MKWVETITGYSLVHIQIKHLKLIKRKLNEVNKTNWVMSKASQRNAQLRHYLLLDITKHHQHICSLNKHIFLWLLLKYWKLYSHRVRRVSKGSTPSSTWPNHSQKNKPLTPVRIAAFKETTPNSPRQQSQSLQLWV